MGNKTQTRCKNCHQYTKNKYFCPDCWRAIKNTILVTVVAEVIIFLIHDAFKTLIKYPNY